MPKGLPRSFIKRAAAKGGSHSQIFKRAWRMYKASKVGRAIRAGTKSRSRKVASKSRNPNRRVRRTARRRKRRGGGRSLQRTVMKWIRVAALVGPGVHSAMGPGTIQDKVDNALWKYTGYSMKHGLWDPSAMMQGWGPFLGAVLATYGIPKIAGILRRL